MADFYVDFSAANNGDGTDGAQAGAPAGVGAFNQMTAGELAGISAGDVIWFRRTGSGSKKAISFKNGSSTTSRIEFNGWPVNSSDEHYAQAQATANTVKGTWDGDGDTHCYASPVGASPTHQYVTFRRIYWEELGASANLAFHVASGAGDFRFYECAAERNAQVPNIDSPINAFGMCEWDRVDVIGTTPGIIQMRGGPGSSQYGRVRITMTDAGSSGYNMHTSFFSSASWYLEILEWNDSGTHYVTLGSSIGGNAAQDWTFTTDDDAVGVLPFQPQSQAQMSWSGKNIILRNLSMNHALAAQPAVAMSVPTNGTRVFLENFEFHPTSHTTQLDIDNQYGELTGRNIKSFDPNKVSHALELTSTAGVFNSFVHFSQINNTEAWYRRMNGSIAQLSTVNRTGGAGNAILVEPQDRPISVQQRGMHASGVFWTEKKGLEAFAFVRTGLGYPAAQTLTAYFAVLNWDGLEDEQRIWFEVELYKNAAAGDFTRKIIDSRKLPKSQSFIADGSTWNNMAGYSAYRVEIPVSIVKDDIIKVRFGVRDTYLDMGSLRNIVAFDPAMTLA